MDNPRLSREAIPDDKVWKNYDKKSFEIIYKPEGTRLMATITKRYPHHKTKSYYGYSAVVVNIRISPCPECLKLGESFDIAHTYTVTRNDKYQAGLMTVKCSRPGEKHEFWCYRDIRRRNYLLPKPG